MVLEELYSVEYIKKKPYFALLLGICYSIIGMGGALFLFPDDPALVAVAITSLLMLPLLKKLVSTDNIFKQAKDTYKIYILLFLGSFLTFAFFSMMLPNMAANFLFKNQMQLYFGSLTGKAFSSGLFMDLFNNNLKVLVFCFIASLTLEGGAIFIIIWNASLWGTVFGMLAKLASATVEKNPWLMFLLIFLIVLPHMILEISSYIVSTISGSLLSVNLLKNKFMSKEFKDKLQKVFIILIIAAAILIVGMIIETYVINNVDWYRTTIQQAFASLSA